MDGTLDSKCHVTIREVTMFPIKFGLRQLGLLVFLASCLCQAAEVKTAEEALQIGRTFAKKLNLDFDFNGARCVEFQQQSDSPKLWKIVGPTGEFHIGINTSNGAVVVLVDTNVFEEIINVDDFRNPYTLNSDADVWNVADRFLNASSLNNQGFERANIDWVCRSKNAELDPNSKSTRVVARYEQRDRTYPGAINTAAITLDAVTGKIEVATASTIWKLQRPASTVSKSEALQRLKSQFAAESSKGNDQARTWDWPGDEAVSQSLETEIVRGGNACFGSRYGDELNRNYSARVCWKYENGLVSAALDAENLNPVWASAKATDPRKISELPTGSKKIEEGTYILPDKTMAIRDKNGSFDVFDSEKPIGNELASVANPTFWALGVVVILGASFTVFKFQKKLARHGLDNPSEPR